MSVDHFIVTHEFLRLGRSPRGAYTARQLEILGLRRIVHRNSIRKAIGLRIAWPAAQEFLADRLAGPPSPLRQAQTGRQTATDCTR